MFDGSERCCFGAIEQSFTETIEKIDFSLVIVKYITEFVLLGIFCRTSTKFVCFLTALSAALYGGSTVRTDECEK